MLCSSNLTVIKLKLRGRRKKRLEVYISSAYVLGDAEGPPPPRDIEDIILHCQENRIPLLLGCETNSYHTVWRSTTINGKGTDLIKYLACTEPEILHLRDTPTFEIKN